MIERTWIVASLLCLLASVSVLAASRPGVIKGTVVDETGKAVGAAQVMVDPMDERPRSKPVRTVETDKDGRFSIEDLELGPYKVFAMKEKEGYPNTALAFYSNHIFPTANLTSSVPTIEMALKIGPPAGVIQGLVLDATTGKPVDATFLLRRASTPEIWMSTAQRASYRVLVPPSTDVMIEVMAPSYKTWYYGGASDPAARPPLRIESKKEQTLNIMLEPEIAPPPSSK